MSQQYPPDNGQPWNNQPYPPQQPPYPPQQVPAYAPGQYAPPTPLPSTKKPKRWPWIVALVVVFFLGIGIGSGTHGSSTDTTTDTATSATTGGGTASQPAPTAAKPVAPAKPTAVPKWTTTHTFTGNGTQKTATFTVPDDWKLNWSCNLAASSMGDQYNVIIEVDGSDGTPLDPVAINTLCKSGNTSGTTEEHQGGSVYLNVTSEDNWSIQVQELK